MICINAGSGTPDEAARWIEYCNGSTDTPMGALRAANGHPEPYGVKYWEIGNELWGKWQYRWTTAKGYVDRYREFSEAMLKADSTIRLYACGAPVMWGKNWNDTLIKAAADILIRTTDHPLIGGRVAADSDPLDVYRDFMAVPDVLEYKWDQLRNDMISAGIKQPSLAVTELQMFARLGEPSKKNAPRLLNHTNLVSPNTHAEALYDVLIYHAAIRLAPFVEMVTHSATVNHGGGLRKSRERVFANPCHYGQAMFADFAGAVPVVVEINSPKQKAPLVLPGLRSVTKDCSYKVIDSVAALDRNGDMLISVVHRGASQPVQLSITLKGFRPEPQFKVTTLLADVPWAANTLENQEAVKPVVTTARFEGRKLSLTLQPYSFTCIRVSRDL
jgi:alpha-N-arabinofuranosidase